MSKRFIDTELFDDSWFMSLSLNAKLLWIYMITKCNHAGVIDLNERLCTFQTGIENIQTVIKELGNRLVTVKKDLYFIPKYIKFQYPEFPNSKVKQQDSALKILQGYKIDFNSYLSVTEELNNSYDNDNVNESVSVNEKAKISKLEILRQKSSYFDSDEIFEMFCDWVEVYETKYGVLTESSIKYHIIDINKIASIPHIKQALADAIKGQYKNIRYYKPDKPTSEKKMVFYKGEWKEYERLPYEKWIRILPERIRIEENEAVKLEFSDAKN